MQNKPIKHSPPLLFNVDVDPSEQYNVAGKYPQIIDQIEEKVRKFKSNLKFYPDQLAPRADHVTVLEKKYHWKKGTNGYTYYEY